MSTKKYNNCEEILHRLKNSLGLKLNKDLARKLGVSENTISTWKKRKSLDIGRILLNCDIDKNYLLTGSPSSEGTKASEGIPRTSPENPPLEALSNTIRLQEELLKFKDETIRLQNELLVSKDEIIALQQTAITKENTVSDLEARLQKLEESNKELEKLREENTSLKKEIAAQEQKGLGEGENQLAS